MDAHSSGEDVLIKIRKPYTISKQREPWTEEEHERFLEALKLHGRAWQQIEEHIGTKTAVQIRSHAQKFFSKLEKVAVVKGVPVSQAIEIDIPPPRPKRKPTNPYPRKTGVCASTSLTSKDGKLLTSVSSSLLSNQISVLDKLLIPEEPVDNTKENGDDNSSVVSPFSKEAPCTSMSSADKLFRPPGKSHSLGEFVPWNTTIESHITVEPKQIQRLENYPTHVPVKILDGSLGTSTQTSFSDVSYQESKFHQGSINPNPFVPSMSAITAATVTAATAWWAAHDLLPSCPQLHGSFPGTPVSVTGTPSIDTVKSDGGKLDIWSITAEQQKTGVETKLCDLIALKQRQMQLGKKVDRSSCCPKTSSSTEAETNAVGKHDKVMEKESNKHDTGNQCGDSMNRRIRSTYNLNESWKEVSDEGKVAFQALFLRHELPQSFSPPHDLTNKESQVHAFYFDTHNADVKNEDSMLPDLNSETVISFSSQEIKRTEEDDLLTFRLGHGSLKTRRVGLKPYKRCSAEGNETQAANASKEKCLKRTRFELETLT